MHELAICQELMKQLEQEAARKGATGVDRVVLSVGPLSGVEPCLLARAFDVARVKTLAAASELEIRTGPVRVSCRSCAAESEAAPSRLLCATCGDWRVNVIEGDELLLLSLELSGIELDCAPARGAPA